MYSLAQVAEYAGMHEATHASGADCHVPGCCMCGDPNCLPADTPDDVVEQVTADFAGMTVEELRAETARAAAWLAEQDKANARDPWTGDPIYAGDNLPF